MPSQRRGFTLVELLAVITIIGILVSMLLPAVQAARESARRMQCLNNLKQIGLAFHHHQETFKFFPTGGLNFHSGRSLTPQGSPEVTNRQAWGWLYQILPFMEQQNVWKLSSDAQIRATPIPAYFCPTRRSPMVIANARAMNDYAGNGGTHTRAGYAWGDGYNGVVVRNTQSPIGFHHISDGSSNTIMVGEKRLDIGAMGTFQCDDNEGYTSGWDWDTIRWGNNPPQADPMSLDQCERWFGASHPGGANFALVDGSARIVHFTVDPEVFRLASIRDDGQVLPGGGL